MQTGRTEQVCTSKADEDPKSVAQRYTSAALQAELTIMLEDCTQCERCVRDCAFLKRYGTPYELAEVYRNGTLTPEIVYSCSLCRLCSAVCLEQLDPSRLFWLMRCELVERGKVSFAPYRAVLFYERAGLSSLFSLHALPPGCRTVFFPGCAIPGSRPREFEQLVAILQRKVDRLGVVLACCGKPSHDLGRFAFFQRHFQLLFDRLLSSGVETILTACPSCQQVFCDYGTGLRVQTVYELLAEDWPAAPGESRGEVRLHDPCNARFDGMAQASVRSLLAKLGLRFQEMNHRGAKTFCCGEGGAAFCVARDLTDQWAISRQQETEGFHLVSYCAGCTSFLGQRQPTSHIIDLLVDGSVPFRRMTKVRRPPFTYLHRLAVKWRLKKLLARG